MGRPTSPSSASTCPGCEQPAILATAQGGTIIFFSMATNFAAAALGAEGLAADVRMLVGNGYVPGHADLALSLLREVPAVRALFESRLAPPSHEPHRETAVGMGSSDPMSRTEPLLHLDPAVVRRARAWPTGPRRRSSSSPRATRPSRSSGRPCASPGSPAPTTSGCRGSTTS